MPAGNNLIAGATAGQEAMNQDAMARWLATQPGMNTPLAMPLLQRSQYLADALKQVGQAGPTIRTGGALASNLLAEALLDIGRKRNDQKLLSLYQGQQAQQLHAGDDLLNPQPAPDPDATLVNAVAKAAPSGTAGLPNVAAGFGNAGAAMSSAAAGMSDPKTQALVQALSSSSQPSTAAPADPSADPHAALADSMLKAGPQGKMFADLVKGGLSPVAASGLVGGFVQESGPNLNLDNPKEGAFGAANWRGARAQALQAYEQAHGGPSVDNQAAFALQELHGPESATLAALNAAQDPRAAAQAALGYERPQGWTPGGNPAAVSGWNNRAANANAAFSQFGQPQSDQTGQGSSNAPFMLSTGGPDRPSPVNTGASPAGGIGAAAANGMASAGAAMQGPQPQGQGGSAIPPVPIQPWQTNELQRLHSLAQQNPAQFGAQFQDYLAGLRKQASTSEETDVSRPTAGGQVYMTGKQTGRVWLRSPNGAIVEAGPRMVTSGGQAQGSGVGGPQGGGFGASGPQGQGPSLQPISSTMPTTSGAPAVGSVTQTDAAGNTKVVQAPQITPDTVLAQANAFRNGTAYQEALKASTAFNIVQHILKQATGNNGMVNMAVFDNLLMSETGLSAKQGGMQMLLEHGGVPNQIQGMFGNLTGTGFIPIGQLQQGVGILHQYALGKSAAAQQELGQINASVRGLSKGAYGDIGVASPTIDPMPNVPWMGGSIDGSNPSGPAAGAQAGASFAGRLPPGMTPDAARAQASQAIRQGRNRQQVLGRLHAMGVDPSGL